jgi:large subunit ribosomal protein L22
MAAEAIARLRFVRMAPRKTRVMVDLIRGRAVNDALATLRFTPRVAARVVEKVLRSAVANAQQGGKDLGDADSLRVSRAFVDNGPTLKRFQPRAQGRAFSIHKRMSHITIAVTPVVEKPKKLKSPVHETPKGKPPAKTAPPIGEKKQPAKAPVAKKPAKAQAAKQPAADAKG